jgi:hypothetical protein
MKSTIGRIVHVRLADRWDGVRHDAPVWRPAIVTSVQIDGSLNLRVFIDRWLDIDMGFLGLAPMSLRRAVLANGNLDLAGVCEGDEPGQWRWPPREDG